MSKLADKIRRSRESWLDFGTFSLLVLRPGRVDLQIGGKRPIDLVCDAVIDWRQVRESDLFEGGGENAVPFDPEACKEWIRDRDDVFAAVLERLESMLKEHREKIASAEKNFA